MKRFLSIAAISAVTFGFTACKNNGAEKQAAALEAQQKTIDSMKIEFAKKQVIDSMQAISITAPEQALPQQPQVVTVVVPQQAPATRTNAVAATPRRTTTTRRTRSSSRSTGYSNGGYAGNSGYSSPAPVYTPARKKGWAGWSAKAKGAVIGAGTGAIGGAIINKRNRAAGAIIGGVGGAAVGTGIGAIIDHKNGR